jgi:hypothetical protein
MSPIYVPGKVVLAKDYIPVDPDFSSVALLLHGDGANGSTTFTDSSPSPRTVTAVGSAQVSTAQKQFGTGSLLFNGTTDYATLTATSAFNFGTGDFTIEMWVRPTSTPASNKALITRYSAWTSGLDFYWRFQTDRVLRFIAGPVAPINIPSDTALALNTWTHVAATRSNGVTRQFIGGVVQSATHSGSVSFPSTGNTIYIAAEAPSSELFPGYIDDLRITKGVARYTGSFTPPTAPFPDTASR